MIKLTELYWDKSLSWEATIYANPDQMIWMGRKEERPSTTTMSGKIPAYTAICTHKYTINVIETPEEILELIEKANS